MDDQDGERVRWVHSAVEAAAMGPGDTGSIAASDPPASPSAFPSVEADDCAAAWRPRAACDAHVPVAAVDSGYQDEDGDCDSVDSDGSTSCSSLGYTGSGALAGLDLWAPGGVLHGVVADGAARVQGDVFVEHSTNVQVGTTHYHGPVTLLVAPGAVTEAASPAAQPAAHIVQHLELADVSDSAAQQAAAVPGKPGSGASPLPSLKKRFLQWPRVAIAGAVLVSLLAAVALVSTLPQSQGPSIRTLANGVRLATRAFWHARTPSTQQNSQHFPPNGIRHVVVCHTAGRQCFRSSDCADLVSNMQQYHVDSRQWGDVGYNFLVGGDGVVYEGRGWDVEGAFLYGMNKRAYGVALIGNFDALAATATQSDQLAKFLDWGVELGKIDPHYLLGGACQYQNTLSPGRRFMEELRTHPHWDPHMDSKDSCVR